VIKTYTAALMLHWRPLPRVLSALVIAIALAIHGFHAAGMTPQGSEAVFVSSIPAGEDPCEASTEGGVAQCEYSCTPMAVLPQCAARSAASIEQIFEVRNDRLRTRSSLPELHPPQVAAQT
jgi:hypothetical protein